MLFNPLGALLTKQYSWRTAILTMSVLTVVLGAVGIALLLHSLRQVGGKANGPIEQKTVQNRVDGIRNAGTWGIFLLCTLCFISASTVTQLYGQLPLYAENVGYDLTVGAVISSICMAGNISGKLLLGALADRLGIWRGMGILIAMVTAAVLVFLLLPGCLPALYVASLLFGFTYAVGAMAPALCCVQIYGTELSRKRLGIHLAVNSGLGALASLVIGRMVKGSGNYRGALAVAAGVCICSLAAVLLMRHKAADQKQETAIPNV